MILGPTKNKRNSDPDQDVYETDFKVRDIAASRRTTKKKSSNATINSSSNSEVQSNLTNQNKRKRDSTVSKSGSSNNLGTSDTTQRRPSNRGLSPTPASIDAPINNSNSRKSSYVDQKQSKPRPNLSKPEGKISKQKSFDVSREKSFDMSRAKTFDMEV